jgi:ribosomal protein L11 methyltransferase
MAKIVLKLQDGYAFGAGDHPTTRMMLRALDLILESKTENSAEQVDQALDIGTGTGILAIAAAGLGVGRVDAIDIDPAACRQAQNNVDLNGHTQCINVRQKSLDPFWSSKYDLLMANLRPPTLGQLFDGMLAVSSEHSKWILSGFRIDECEQIKKRLPKEMSEFVWEEEQYDWVAFVVNRKIGAGNNFGCEKKGNPWYGL